MYFVNEGAKLSEISSAKDYILVLNNLKISRDFKASI